VAGRSFPYVESASISYNPAEAEYTLSMTVWVLVGAVPTQHTEVVTIGALLLDAEAIDAALTEALLWQP